MDTSGGSVHLNFNLSNKDGLAVGTIDSPDQGAMGIPISFISAGENLLKLEVKLIPAAYHGSLSGDGKTLTGEWLQGGKALPLVLTKQ